MDHSGTEELIPLVSGDGRERMFQKSKGRALTSSQHRSDQTDDSSTTSIGIFFLNQNILCPAATTLKRNTGRVHK